MKQSGLLLLRKERELDEVETYTLLLHDLSRRLKTDTERGLSQEDAEERLRVSGPNVIPKVKPGLFEAYIAPFLNWLINIYLTISTILAFFALLIPEVWTQVVQWLSVVAINAALAIVQQTRAQTKIEAIQRLSAPKSKVIRHGRLVVIPSERVVPGDIIKLEQGDRVPADARIVAAYSLKVNEASLTGESEEVEKLEGDMPLEEDTPISGRRNTLFLGTYVTVGSARALVVKTGSQTHLGKISKELEKLSRGEIPLLRKVNAIAKYLGIAVLIYLCISLTYQIVSLHVANNLMDTYLVAGTIVRSLVTAMSIMPINIPLLTTIILLTGVLAMARHEVMVRNLNVVESLGRVSVVCADKTGTITKNEMTVKWICFPTMNSKDHLYGVTGVGFQPDGQIIAINSNQSLEEILRKEPDAQDGTKVRIGSETPLEYLLASGMLNNESTLVEEKVKTTDAKREQTIHKPLGDATDASILILFGKSELDESHYRDRFKEIRRYLFNSKAKRMTRVFKDNDRGRYVVFTKGATEVLLPRCNSGVADGVIEMEALNNQSQNLINRKVDLFASSGHRVISFAFRYLDELPSRNKTDRESLERDLVYLGFVAIMDPPREEVRESVSEAKGAGIKPVMITGDSLETAKSIAQQVGIAEQEGLSVQGAEIESLSDEEFSKTSVFARVSPEHKMMIVDRYKKQNRVVAMTGDGVNDALAISMADVGISTGITGTDVAKQAADMIVADDSFSSIVVGIREGRGILQKIRTVIFFYIAVNFAEALIYFGSSLIPGLYLLNLWQQIYIFITTHSLPPFALIIHRFGKEMMKEKPRDTEGINRQQKFAFLFFTISLALMFYIVYSAALDGIIPVSKENKLGYTPDFSPDDYLNPANWAQAKARTMLHTVAFIAECTLIVSLRRINKPIYRTLREDSDWITCLLVLIVPFAHLILMYIPQAQLILVQFLGINLEVIRLAWTDWIIAIVLGLIPIVSLESYKMWMRKHGLIF